MADLEAVCLGICAEKPSEIVTAAMELLAEGQTNGPNGARFVERTRVDLKHTEEMAEKAAEETRIYSLSGMPRKASTAFLLRLLLFTQNSAGPSSETFSLFGTLSHVGGDTEVHDAQIVYFRSAECQKPALDAAAALIVLAGHMEDMKRISEKRNSQDTAGVN